MEHNPGCDIARVEAEGYITAEDTGPIFGI